MLENIEGYIKNMVVSTIREGSCYLRCKREGSDMDIGMEATEPGRPKDHRATHLPRASP